VGTALATAATAALIAAGSAVPASATTALTVSLPSCHSPGSGDFECYLSISGGTAPYTTTWTGTWVTYTETGPTYADGDCWVPGNGTGIAQAVATVTDSAGQSVTRSANFSCRQA
jgi:hypothetical protein